MKIIGLTGGIGSGKSTVSEYLKSKGYHIIDADAISHKITEKGTDTLDRISSCFGTDILKADGSLDRRKLAEIVFNNSDQKKKLEELTTKVVLEKIKNEVNYLRKDCRYDIIFIDAPLLFETGAHFITDYVWLVTADKETRINRVIMRDNTSRQEVEGRILNQMDDSEKAKLSSDIIDNSNGKDILYQQIDRLLKKYAK